MVNIKKIIPEQDLIRLYLEEEKSLRYIGDIYGVAPDTVKARLKEYGIDTRDAAAWIRGKKEPPERTLARARGLIGKKHTPERKINQSNARKKFFKNGGKNWNEGLIKGEHPSIENQGVRKEEHWAWKGGSSAIGIRIRQTGKYKRWRISVLDRDKKCVKCGSNKNLIVHHIKRFFKIVEYKSYEEALQEPDLFDISNGETLCAKCHYKEHEVENTDYIQAYNLGIKKGD